MPIVDVLCHPIGKATTLRLKRKNTSRCTATRNGLCSGAALHPWTSLTDEIERNNQRTVAVTDTDIALTALPDTTNTSPLTQHVRIWYKELCQVHEHCCKDRHTCTGVAPLHVILASDPWDPQRAHTMCLQAIETELLIHGVHYGFRVLRDNAVVETISPFHVENYPTTEECANALEKTLDAECQAGILKRVHETPSYVTALHAKVEKDKIRTLCDYSKPEAGSVNSHADARHFTMMSHESAYALMRPYHFMAKVDIKAAFRTVGVHPSHWRLLAYKWTRRGIPEYYLDTRFPFGLRCSPEIFCRLSQAVRAMMAARGYDATVVYVDDFWIIAATEAECEEAKQTLVALLRSLGFTLSEHKIEGPAQTMAFLGLLLSTNHDGKGGMQVTVPSDKLEKAVSMARELAALRQTHISLRKLQSAIGYFQHIANAIYPARAFLRRLIWAATAAEARGDTQIEITRSVRLDLQFWAEESPKYNGTAVLLDKPQLVEGFLATDASGELGMGGFFNGAHFGCAWNKLDQESLPQGTRKYNNKKLWPKTGCPMTESINYKEMFAIWWALLKWGGSLRNKCVTLHCDNDTARYCFNKLRAHRSVAMMRLLRHAAKFMAKYNIRLRVVRITSAANVLADALSRLDMQRFAKALHEWNTQRLHECEAPQWESRTFASPPLLEQKAAEYRPDLEQEPHVANIAETDDEEEEPLQNDLQARLGTTRSEQPYHPTSDAKRQKASHRQ